MYAVIRTGGRQYKVSEGDIISVEKLVGEEGNEIELGDVLMVGGESTIIGAPTVEGALVKVVIKKQYRHKRILIHKFKRRKNYQTLNGHRQPYTQLEIKKIVK